MIRILIADHQDVVREGLRAILESNPHWRVVAEASDGREAILKSTDAKPDVAVIDCALPTINGLEVTRQIRAQLPHTQVLVFTMHDNEARRMAFLRAGARGYLLKSDAACQLVAAVKALAAKKSFLSPRISEVVWGSMTSGQWGNEKPVLTNREVQVVQLIAEGHTNKETARVLGISVKTVETHRATAMRKLNCDSSAGLVRYAVRNDLVRDAG